MTGVITKTYGFEGAVVVRVEGGYIREPVQGEPVFIIIDGSPVPFFTREAFSPSPGTLIISFDDYFTAESVGGLRGCILMSRQHENSTDYQTDLTGYTIVDIRSGFQGIISGIISHPGQVLAVIKTSDGDVYVPLHPDLIITIDKHRKTIKMSLPEGLTGLNL